MADQQTNSEPGTPATGFVAARHKLRGERGEVASWLILMAGLAAAALLAAGALSLIINQLTDDVAAAAEGNAVERDTAPPSGTATDSGTADPDEGVPNASPNTEGAEPLPVRTRHCSVTVKASGAVLGITPGAAVSGDVIIQEMPDGTTLVTIAGELAGSVGESWPAGAGITVNDVTVGAYARASAAAWGAVGGGVQYELAPGESVAELFVGLGISANPITGGVSNGINTIFPDTVPTASLPNTVFVDGSIWAAAGGTAQAGIGWVSAGANATGEARRDETYAVHDDGTYSATTTYSGELSADAGVTGGVPFFAWGSTEAAGQAQGSVSVQTIYDSSFNPVEMIVTTSYGYDVDAPGSDPDNPTITTQQWTLDLTDPEVAEAVTSLDQLVSNISPLPGVPTIPDQNPVDAWDVVTDNAATTGPSSQELSSSGIDVNVEAGAIVAGVRGGVNGTCTELR